MENKTELKWFQKQSGIIILLIIFFPVGLYLMWKNNLWTKKTRWIVTIALLVIVVLGQNGKTTSSSSSSNSSTGEISLDEAVSIAQEKAMGSGHCQFADVYKSVENESGNYGILLSCGGGPKNYILYEINKQGEVMSADFTD
jgi:hypothetical protein